MLNKNMLKKTVLASVLASVLAWAMAAQAQDFMINVPARQQESLNGKWQGIIDPVDVGIAKWKAVYNDKKTGRVEYGFEGGPLFDVPGDFNSQYPELTYYESTVWYKKTIQLEKKPGKRQFLYFDAANYKADVFFNSEKIGSHEGGFTPFQFEITDQIKAGDNTVIVRVNNARDKYGVPALGYDWFNYGGLTRDVRLLEVPETYIDDYYIQLEKGSKRTVKGYVKLDGAKVAQQVHVQIPEAGVDYKVTTDAEGYATVQFEADLQLWNPENPKRYDVVVRSETDSVKEKIGFRSIEVRGEDILLNGAPIFLKGVNFHEEMPQRKGRAWSRTDARVHLTWAKELGCNFIRTAHYPQNENVVRLAEEMGFMLWSEIPVFQSIQFKNKQTVKLCHNMLNEMIRRDKNRCGVIIWSISNETYPSTLRTRVLTDLANACRERDPTRLVSTAFNKYKKEGLEITLDDELIDALDVIGMNEYLGWYGGDWSNPPQQYVWKSPYNKPMIISEYGAEAMYGNHGPADDGSCWYEEFQERFFINQIAMQKEISFLAGSCPWTLIDFRSNNRLNPVWQQHWNRKGLLSEFGDKKKAWQVVNEFYSENKR